jgi:hypothetical protein
MLSSLGSRPIEKHVSFTMNVTSGSTTLAVFKILATVSIQDKYIGSRHEMRGKFDKRQFICFAVTMS